MKRVSVFLMVCVSLVSILMTQHAAAAPPTPQQGVEEGVVLGHVIRDGAGMPVEIVDNYAYLGFQTYDTEFTFGIIDHTDKSNPFIASELEMSSRFKDVAVVDQTAYLIGNSDLTIVDISNPTMPVIVEIRQYESPENIIYYGDHLYLLTRHKLLAYRLDAPTILTEIGSVAMNSVRHELEILNDRAFVRDSGGVPIEEALRVIDISDPTNMHIVGGLNAEGGTILANSVGIDRYILYIGGCSSICMISTGLYLYDSKTFEVESRGWTFWQADWSYGLKLDGPYAYVPHIDGLLVYDLFSNEDNFESARPIVEYDIRSASEIVVEGEYIYVNGRGGFYIGLAMPRDDMYLPLLLQE